MLLRLADDVTLTTDGHEATALGLEAGPVVFLDGDRLAQSLGDVLVRPREERRLREELARDLGEEPVDSLVAAGVLVRGEVGERLAELHRRTTLLPSAPGPHVGGDRDFLLREYGYARGVSLPEPAPVETPLDAALSGRRTERAFSGDRLSLEQLSTLLDRAAGFGDGPGLPLAAGGLAAMRTYPSGGALYPVETHVLPLRVEGLPAALFRYQPLGRRLAARGPAPPLSALALWIPDCPLAEVAALILLTADLARPSLERYGEKAYRLALLEAGHLAQNILLLAAAADLGTLPLCGLEDEPLALGLGLEHPYEVVLYAVAVGGRGP